MSFEDLLTGKEESKKGYMKLVGCCKQAQRDGLHLSGYLLHISCGLSRHGKVSKATTYISGTKA